MEEGRQIAAETLQASWLNEWEEHRGTARHRGLSDPDLIQIVDIRMYFAAGM